MLDKKSPRINTQQNREMKGPLQKAKSLYKMYVEKY